MGKGIQAFSPLVWGVKASLVAYVRGLGDGEIAVLSPAEPASPVSTTGQDGSEAFVFAPEPNGSHFDIATRTGQLRFGGTVTFSGHFNTMRVELSDPRLDLRDGTGTLSVRTNGRIGTPRWDAIATAVVLPSPQRTQALSIGLALTAAGRLLLGQQYPVGQPLDPASVAQVQTFQ
jgi:hypothetical protein